MGHGQARAEVGVRWANWHGPTIQKMFNVFISSPQRWEILKEHLPVSLHKMSKTRWAARIDCVRPIAWHLESVSHMYLALLTKILNEQFEMGSDISHLAWPYYQLCTGLGVPTTDFALVDFDLSTLHFDFPGLVDDGLVSFIFFLVTFPPLSTTIIFPWSPGFVSVVTEAAHCGFCSW